MGMECLGTRVERGGLVVEARLSLNQMAQTLEVVAARRQCLVRDLCTQLKRELELRGLGHADCVEKSQLVKRLLDSLRLEFPEASAAD